MTDLKELERRYRELLERPDASPTDVEAARRALEMAKRESSRQPGVVTPYNDFD